MNGERKRTSLKVVIAKIDDAIQELRGLDYVGDKWALIADLLRVRNDVNTELKSRHDVAPLTRPRIHAQLPATRLWRRHDKTLRFPQLYQ